MDWVRTLGLASLAALAMGLAGRATEAGTDVDLEWPQYGGGPTHDNARPVANAVRWPKVLWRVAGARGQPTVGGGFLFTGGESLLKIDPATGRVVASRAAGGEGSVRVADAPVLTPSSVIARSTDGRVFAVDRDLKDVTWTWHGPAGRDPRWSGVLADGGPYVLAAGGEVVALSPTNGEVLWRTKLPDAAEVSTTPAAHGGRVFLGTERGTFLALDLATGRPVWTRAGRAKYMVTVPVVAFGSVFVGDRGIEGERAGAVNAFDAASGELRWSTVFGATGFSTPGVVRGPAGGARIVAGFGRSVAFFDAETGERAAEPAIRTGPNAFGSPTVVGDTLYFGNLDGHLYAHDVATGALRWSFELPLAEHGSSRHQVGDFTYAHDRVYVSTTLGLFAIGQDPAQGTAPEGFVLACPALDAAAVPPAAARAGPVAPPRPPPTGTSPAAIAEDWTRDAMQLRDAGLRASTIAAVRAALAGSDVVAAHAALLTLARIGKVAYDKAAMRPLVLAWLEASEGAVRVAAAYALFNTAWEPEDLDLVLRIPEDPSPDARRAASHLVTMFAKGRLDGAAGAAVARLLDAQDPSLVREALRGLWGATVSAGVEDRLLALAKAPATRHDAIYFGLSTLEGKSARVVDALVDALGDPDVVNVAGRALWGLGHGVPPEHRARAADGLLLLLRARDDVPTQSEALRVLGQYGNETHAKALDALASDAQVVADVRLAAANAAGRIRDRARRGG